MLKIGLFKLLKLFYSNNIIQITIYNRQKLNKFTLYLFNTIDRAVFKCKLCKCLRQAREILSFGYIHQI